MLSVSIIHEPIQSLVGEEGRRSGCRLHEDVGLGECSGSSLVCYFAVQHSSGNSSPQDMLGTFTIPITMRPDEINSCKISPF